MGEAPSPEGVPWILDQFDEGDEETPLHVGEREESDVSDNEFVTMSSGNKKEGSYRVWHACLCVCGFSLGSPDAVCAL